MKQLTFIFLSLFFIFFYNETTAQVDPNPEIDYEVIIKEGDVSGVCGVLGIDNNEAIIAYFDAIKDENGFIATYFLSHLNDKGSVENNIELPAIIYYIGKMYAPDSYLAMGCRQIEEERVFMITVFKFNRELQIEWEKVIDTMYYGEESQYPLPHKMLFQFWDNTYYLAVSGQEWAFDKYQHSTLYKMDTEGNILLKKDFYSEMESNVNIHYIGHVSGTNQFLINALSGEYSDYRTWIMSDENFENASQFTLPSPSYLLGHDLDMEYINETEFIYSGVGIGFGQEVHMGLRKGTLSKPQMKTRFWHWDRFSGPVGAHGGYFKTMALQNNYFYYGITDQMYNKTNNLILAAFNHNLDSLWTAYLKDDADYELISIAPMTDGSCLLGARRNFYDDYGGETSDAYFIKIKTPEVLQNLAITEQKKLPAIEVYPNPTSGELHVTSDVLHVTGVEVFDIYGRKHEGAKGRKHEGANVIDISGLPVGGYLLKISTDAGEVVRKVVKY